MTYTDPKIWRDALLHHLTEYCSDVGKVEHLDEALKIVQEMDPLTFVEGCKIERPLAAIKYARTHCDDETLIDMLSRCGARTPNIDEALELLADVPGEAAEAARLALEEGTPLIPIPIVSFKRLQDMAVDPDIHEDVIREHILKAVPERHPGDERLLAAKEVEACVIQGPERQIHIHIHGV